MGSIKDRNGMDLTEAEDIKKRWQEYTEEPYKIVLHDPENHNGMIIRLEPEILECEVKWALESITMNKASGGDGIPMELFQILMPKNAQTTAQLHSSHMLVKCSKFSKPGFSNTWTMNFQMFKLVLEKAEEPEIKSPTSLDHRKSKRVP